MIPILILIYIVSFVVSWFACRTHYLRQENKRYRPDIKEALFVILPLFNTIVVLASLIRLFVQSDKPKFLSKDASKFFFLKK